MFVAAFWIMLLSTSAFVIGAGTAHAAPKQKLTETAWTYSVRPDFAITDECEFWNVGESYYGEKVSVTCQLLENSSQEVHLTVENPEDLRDGLARFYLNVLYGCVDGLCLGPINPVCQLDPFGPNECSSSDDYHELLLTRTRKGVKAMIKILPLFYSTYIIVPGEHYRIQAWLTLGVKTYQFSINYGHYY